MNTPMLLQYKALNFNWWARRPTSRNVVAAEWLLLSHLPTVTIGGALLPAEIQINSQDFCYWRNRQEINKCE